MHKILITGSHGFIGSNLTKKLASKHELFGVDDLSTGRMNNLDNVEIQSFYRDFADDFILDKIKEKKFDYVVHLAAMPRVQLSVDKPLETTNNNILKTTKLLDACRDNVKRFIFASSSSVVGPTDQLPTKENHSKNPQSPYAWQKSCIEELLKIFNNLYGLDSVSLRFFNVFGPSQYGGDAYATAIGNWLSAIKNNSELRFDGDGTQTRDLTYVGNVVQAIEKCINFDGFLNAEVFNIGCGERFSNNEIMDFLKSKYSNLNIRYAPKRPGDVQDTQADVSKAQSMLGYEPETKFWDGLNKTISWWNL